MAKLEIKFHDYLKDGNKYVRARANVTLMDGSSVRLEGYGKNRLEARCSLEKSLEKKNQVIQYGMKKDSGDITLAEAVLQLIEEREKEYDREKGREARRDTSSQRDRDVFKTLLEPFSISKKPINAIFVSDLDKYRKDLDNARYDKKRTKKKHTPIMVPYSASSLNRIIRLVVQVLDEYYLYQDKKSPTAVLKQFKQTSRAKTEEDFLIGDEVKIALDYFRQAREQNQYSLDVTCADMFIVALLIGARPGEITGLRKRDWDPQYRELFIQRTSGYEDGRIKTPGSIRKIIVPDEVKEILNRRCEGIKENDLIFAGTRKNVLSASNCNKKLKRWLSEAGIRKNLHTHSLRGSSGTYLLDNGVPIDAVSKLLGHERVSTTQAYYTTYTETRRKRDAEQICRIFNHLSLEA